MNGESWSRIRILDFESNFLRIRTEIHATGFGRSIRGRILDENDRFYYLIMKLNPIF